MHRLIDIFSAICIIPLVFVLGWFLLLSLLGNFTVAAIILIFIISLIATSILNFKNNHKSFVTLYYIIHIMLVILAAWYLTTLIDSPNTDSDYYRPFYRAFYSLPFVFITPFIHLIISQIKQQNKLQ